HLPPVEIAPNARGHLVKRSHRSHRSHRCQDPVSLPLFRSHAVLCHVLTSPALLGSLALPLNNRHCSSSPDRTRGVKASLPRSADTSRRRRMPPGGTGRDCAHGRHARSPLHLAAKEVDASILLRPPLLCDSSRRESKPISNTF